MKYKLTGTSKNVIIDISNFQYEGIESDSPAYEAGERGDIDDLELFLWGVAERQYTQSQAKRMHELLGYIAESYRGTMAGEQSVALLTELKESDDE